MRTFLNVSSKQPCFICKKTDWCSISSDGQVFLCRRIPNVNEKIDKNGAPFWVWRNSMRQFSWVNRPQQPVVQPNKSQELACTATLHSVYSALIDTLSLDQHHYRHLKERGFTAEDIIKNGYRSLPKIGRIRLCKGLVSRMGSDAISQTPGFIIKEARFGKHWTIGGYDGILIPVRNEFGQICAIRVRRRDGLKPRYSYLSSGKYGGCSPNQFVHFPLGTNVKSTERLRITEGELKADIVSQLDPIPTISVAGVSFWKFALPYILKNRPIVHVAFDLDAFTKPHVWRQLKSFVEALRALNIETIVETWDDHVVSQCVASRLMGGHHVHN